MGRALWQRQRRVDPAYGPAVFDAQPARDTLAEAEAALRAGDAGRAEATYLRTLGKLGPFSDPAWQSDRATDQRTRSQCHARLAALAFDQRDYDRSLRQTAAATAARRAAIAIDQCTNDDVRFMITALVHAATVHERVGALGEAIRSCQVAIEFADYSRTRDNESRTRRSVESARAAATRLLDELERLGATADDVATIETSATSDVLSVQAGEEVRSLDLTGLYEPPPVEISSLDLPGLTDPRPVAANGSEPIDLHDLEPETEPEPAPVIAAVDLRDIEPETGPEPVDDDTDLVIDLTGSAAVLDLTDRPDEDPTGGPTAELTREVDDLDDDPVVPVDARFERRPDHHRARQQARRAEREAARARAAQVEATQVEATPVEATPERAPASPQDQIPAGDRRQPAESAQPGEPAAVLLAQARAHALTARFLAAHDDGSAAVHAHRAVRTATRARPLAKHDEPVTIEVAVTLVDTLVTRSDVLARSGNEEMSRTDLRRAGTVAEHLWRACPSARSAAAAVLVATRTAAREWDRGDKTELAAHLEHATAIIVDAEALGVALPESLVVVDEPDGGLSERDALMALGDRLFEVLETAELDPVAVG